MKQKTCHIYFFYVSSFIVGNNKVSEMNYYDNRRGQLFFFYEYFKCLNTVKWIFTNILKSIWIVKLLYGYFKTIFTQDSKIVLIIYHKVLDFPKNESNT